MGPKRSAESGIVVVVVLLVQGIRIKGAFVYLVVLAEVVACVKVIFVVDPH